MDWRLPNSAVAAGEVNPPGGSREDRAGTPANGGPAGAACENGSHGEQHQNRRGQEVVEHRYGSLSATRTAEDWSRRRNRADCAETKVGAMANCGAVGSASRCSIWSRTISTS